MPPSIFCPDTTWTGTQILLSEQHCAPLAGFLLPPAGWRDAAGEWKGDTAQAKKKPVVMTGFLGRYPGDAVAGLGP